jgi:hypothetical protein
VFLIEPRCSSSRHEELRTVGSRSGVGHTDGIWSTFKQTREWRSVRIHFRGQTNSD